MTTNTQPNHTTTYPYRVQKIPHADNPNEDYYLVVDGHGNFIAKTYSFFIANLFSNAPKLLKTLEDVQARLNYSKMCPEKSEFQIEYSLQAIDQAITKAWGNS